MSSASADVPRTRQAIPKSLRRRCVNVGSSSWLNTTGCPLPPSLQWICVPSSIEIGLIGSSSHALLRVDSDDARVMSVDPSYLGIEPSHFSRPTGDVHSD